MKLISAICAYSGGFESDFVLVRHLLVALETDVAPGWLLRECYYYLSEFKKIANRLMEVELVQELEAKLERIARLGSEDELQSANIDLGSP